MKLLIVLCSLAALARGSLEPAGYRSPGSYNLQSKYLPPSAGHSRLPENHYVPTSEGSKRNHDISIIGSQLLPSQNVAAPFSQYLPSNQQSYDGHNIGQTINPSSNYLPSSQNEHSFTQALPVSEYLPPRQSHHGSAPDNSNAYLAPNAYSGQSSSDHRYSGSSSAHRHGKIEQANSGSYYSSFAGQHSASGSTGHRYGAPENHTPAQYDFEYKVKDNYGNDYGHKESRNGEHTQGVYMVLLPDGRRQTVHYEADSHGYRPTITYEDTNSQSKYNNQGYQY